MSVPTSRLQQKFSENRHCALDISPIFTKYSLVHAEFHKVINVEFHKVIKLIKNNKIYEIFVKIGSRGTFTRLSCSPAVSDIFVEI